MCEFLGTMCEGSFAATELAQHLLARTKVTVKVIENTQQNTTGLQGLFYEAQTMKALNAPNIMKSCEGTHTEKIFLV